VKRIRELININSMFQLIAIRPFAHCKSYIRKCLRSNTYYYFCDQYVFENEALHKREDGQKSVDNFFHIGGADVNITLSAIVGKNGDGKSTIVELMMRLINNFTSNVYGLMTEVNPTIRIEGVAAELYYLQNECIYRLYDEQGHGEVKLQKIAVIEENGNIRMLAHREDVDNQNQLAVHFFYTMVSNYSHYAYNIYDFRKEWVSTEERGNDENERCWLYYIFHKNDGYRTPLVLNPYRNKGNIDVNNEAYLNQQRLISLFLDAEEPRNDRPSFRNLYGKTAKYVALEVPGESKLEMKSIVEYFTACMKDELLSRAINKTKEINTAPETHHSDIEECLQLLRQIQGSWIHRNENLLRAIIEWDQKEKARRNVLNEERGFLTARSDLRRWIEVLDEVNFGAEYEEEKKRLVNGIRGYCMFNLAQLQRIGLINYVCYLMGGHDESFVPGHDAFDLTSDEIASPYEMLSLDKKCQHYIIYKIIAIFETYLEDYKRPCRMYDGSVIGENTIPNSYVSNAIVKLWDDIHDRPSHINLKLRQALYYRQHYLSEQNIDVFTEIDMHVAHEIGWIKDKLNENREQEEASRYLVMPLENLKENINDVRDLEQLPPPFYYTHIIFMKDDNPVEIMTLEMMSSGERQRLASLSGVVYHLRNINSIDEGRIQYHHVNIVLEEIELYFHPECQRMFIKELIEAIERIGLTSVRDVNILFVTHSPFILSDIPNGNVLLIDKGLPVSEDKKKQLTTFGANVYDMLKTGFFLEGPVGAFAQHVVNEVVESLRKEDPRLNQQQIKERIELIDEPVMKRLLIDEYSIKFDNSLKREYLEEELRKLDREQHHVEA